MTTLKTIEGADVRTGTATTIPDLLRHIFRLTDQEAFDASERPAAPKPDKQLAALWMTLTDAADANRRGDVEGYHDALMNLSGQAAVFAGTITAAREPDEELSAF